MSLLVATDLHKAFGPTPALDGAGISVRSGEIVAIMGPSGSGKSTLLHCLAGILAPDSGTVRYGDVELGSLPDGKRSELRRTDFGFVFQFGQLVPELTSLENVALPLRLGGVKRKDAERSATEWLDRLEVSDVAGKRPRRGSTRSRARWPSRRAWRRWSPRARSSSRGATARRWVCSSRPAPSSSASTATSARALTATRSRPSTRRTRTGRTPASG
jgi:ABC-type lipoprotein export system ATPase subunit